ncbi:MAG TPA: DNA gyrase subunit A [Candidatus Fimihabitans intestinipullorum]|uniref:DNA gyrase subunit A n=1 Tax=Candidatus Fimihabitans intestinipullorum TaxID=2840820 RepID=A0A9D1HTJ4_9BACT|nr:DNA gyrase subunit A [Candidatus Fimihabitans intestinipullorum]
MDKLEQNNIVEEIERSFLNYSMSVIAARALPDLRDGLKPVHRRILYAMYTSGYTPDKPHKKSARIVGEVMGKYHPHGDSSIYEAMVRMAQDFSYRYMLVDGHGNFGNIEGSGAAAMRYTESRLSKISLELLRNINKDTVDFRPNFDELEKEPVVLPSRFPNILVNGTTGIAVGMATNIPPHNLSEVIDGCIAYIDNPDIDVDGLMHYIKGPDFPTGASILGNSGIKKAYETGKGTITIRSKARIEESHGRQHIIIDEVPYGINTLELKNKVAELVHNKVIEGISDYHSDLKDGIKITITLKKDANAQVVLNKLYKHTAFQTNYGITFLMLDQGVPKTLGLKEIISKYIDFQKEVIIRRTKFDLNNAEKRVHILEGLKIALDNIDEIIKLIKAAKSDDVAREGLMSRFGLSEAQANAILEMKLRRLTGLEREKIENELAELLKLIENLRAILNSDEKIYGVIKDELLEIKNKYGDERRTNIDMTAIDYIEDESLIPVENIVVTLTNKGYIKRTTSETYRTQNRGGVGVKGMTTNEEDFVENMISMTTHDYLLFFTNKGKVYRIKGYEVPQYSRQSKGLPIINLLQIDKDEVVKVMLKVSTDEESKYLVFCTQSGIVKRTDIKEFDNIRKSGKMSITLKDDDELISVKKTTGNNEILIASSNGRMIRFNENEIRVMGRSASGVRGIDTDGGICVGCEIANEKQEILVVTENGYGKKTPLEEYRLTHRGSKGVKALNVTEKNGNIVSFKVVNGDEDLMIITDSGIIIRLSLDQVSKTGRVAQGVRLIHLKDNQKVSTLALIAKEEEEEDNNATENE